MDWRTGRQYRQRTPGQEVAQDGKWRPVPWTSALEKEKVECGHFGNCSQHILPTWTRPGPNGIKIRDNCAIRYAISKEGGRRSREMCGTTNGVLLLTHPTKHAQTSGDTIATSGKSHDVATATSAARPLEVCYDHDLIRYGNASSRRSEQ